jgi:hypothetical protein
VPKGSEVDYNTCSLTTCGDYVVREKWNGTHLEQVCQQGHERLLAPRIEFVGYTKVDDGGWVERVIDSDREAVEDGMHFIADEIAEKTYLMWEYKVERRVTLDPVGKVLAISNT